MATTENEPSQTILIALQNLFYKLQFSETSVSTEGLIGSFGWGNKDTLIQHDVQEVCSVLYEELKNKMKV